MKAVLISLYYSLLILWISGDETHGWVSSSLYRSVVRQQLVSDVPNAETSIRSLTSSTMMASPTSDEEIGAVTVVASSTAPNEPPKDEPLLIATEEEQLTDSKPPRLAGLSKSSSSSTPSGPTAQDLMLAMGTNPRRIFMGTLSATGIALAGNFLGVTSKLLTLLPEGQVEAVGIDTYFPRGGYKRYRTSDYTFVVPAEWVADTFLELAKAQRKIQPLDYAMSRQQQQTQRSSSSLPDAAYGPPGRLNEKGVSESGDTNVSVIVSSGLTGFSLRGSLGTPTSAAQTLLSTSIAPEGSGRVATLLSAVAENENSEQPPIYKFEYIVDRGTRGPPLRSIAVIAGNLGGDKLYTMTVVAPAEKWKDSMVQAQLRKIADSFHLRT
jgi:hypothetical protein